jgi:uracil-DNA glycosylase family 4
MKSDNPERAELLRAIDLLDDFFAGGFARLHPESTSAGTSGMAAAAAEKPEARVENPEPRGKDAEARQIEVPVARAAEDPQARAAEMTAIAAEVAQCAKCALSMNRNRTVPGEGVLDPAVLLVGEGPGEDEDKTGRPFVGRAGQYLETWLKSISLSRAACFIANCVKCRPPLNREPRPEEILACGPYLERQISALRPRLILCLGRIAAHHLIGTQASLSALRGKVHSRNGTPLLVTYHPSAVLRDQSLRRPVWEDLKLLKTLM